MYRKSPIKGNVKTNVFRLGSMPVLYCLGIQSNFLNVVSYSESGVLEAKGFALSLRVKQSINGSPLWSHCAVVTASIVF